MDNANAASAVSPNPKQTSSLPQRIISALVLLPIIIFLAWWSYWSVAFVVTAVIIAALLELYGGFTHGGFRPVVWAGITAALALVGSVALQPLVPSVDLVPIALTLVVVGSLIAQLSRTADPQPLTNWALTLAGACYVAWLFSYLIRLRAIDTPLNPFPLAALGLPSGAAWVFGVMAITWLQDTFAYFVGKRFGRTPFAPRISPKKTWEGAFGGMLGAVVGAIASIYVFCLPLSIPQAVLLGLVGGVVGPLGDLSESLMKRQVGIKDAGNIIPGHGGILDRADSLLFTAPVLYYLILLLIR